MINHEEVTEGANVTGDENEEKEIANKATIRLEISRKINSKKFWGGS